MIKKYLHLIVLAALLVGFTVAIVVNADAIVQLTVSKTTLYPGDEITLSWTVYHTANQVNATVYMTYNNNTAVIASLTNETSYTVTLEAVGNYEFYVVVGFDDNTTAESNHVSVVVMEPPVNSIQSLFYAMIAIMVPIVLISAFVKIIGKQIG